jgi:hypothetical protein
MFKETKEGQTYSCTHKEDGSVCGECLTGKIASFYGGIDFGYLIPQKLNWFQKMIRFIFKK